MVNSVQAPNFEALRGMDSFDQYMVIRAAAKLEGSWDPSPRTEVQKSVLDFWDDYIANLPEYDAKVRKTGGFCHCGKPLDDFPHKNAQPC